MAVAEDDDAWAYTEAMEVLSAAGYEHYEVSNFARPGWRSRHNWGYWHGAPYLGVGLGAHSFIDGVRWWNVRNLRKYLQAMASGTSPCAGREVLTAAQARAEQIWLRLRTCEGVRLSAWERERLQRQPRFGQLIEAGLLCLEGDCLRLTRAGMPLADALGVEVVRLREAPAPPAVAERR
ncbi:MAG: hypothetical protein KatS3mg131_0899 [Candidatus Tectimicrobiota bacterium]|nr:MAG: hypothetical protein KatS3mg131_0899 [Candidatus Tectomicrobia bacterium]